MKEFNERLKIAMNLKKITQSELCELTGIPKSAMSQYVSGAFAPKQERTYLIAKALNVNEAWLLGYDDISMDREPRRDDLSELMQKYDNIKPIKLKRFPMLGEIACGKPIFADEDREHYIMADMDIDADFCLTAKGDSMINARIYNGDIVFIKEMPMVENGDIAAVIIEDEATLKRVYYYPEKGKLILNPENPSCEPLVYIGDELNYIRILGKAVYFMSAVE